MLQPRRSRKPKPPKTFQRDEDGPETALPLRLEPLAEPSETPDSPARQPYAEEAGIKDEINSFLLSLPLGTSAQDARIEDSVAACLLRLHREKADLQHTLDEWIEAAADLRDIVQDQQEEIKLLRREILLPGVRVTTSGSCEQKPKSEQGCITQQQAILELTGLITSLREDLKGKNPAHGHPAYDAMLARLGTTQQQLRALHAAHDLASRQQASLHRMELEAAHADMQKLEDLAEKRLQAAQQGSEERELLRRLHVATEVDLERSTRTQATLEDKLQAQNSANAELEAELADAQQSRTALEQKLQSRAVEIGELQHELKRQRSAHEASLAQQAVPQDGFQRPVVLMPKQAPLGATARTNVDCGQQTDMVQPLLLEDRVAELEDELAIREAFIDSLLAQPTVSYPSTDLKHSSEERIKGLQSASRCPFDGPETVAGTPNARDSHEEEAIARELAAGAWRRALTGHIDTLKAKIEVLESQLQEAQDAAAGHFKEQLTAARDLHAVRLAAAQETFCWEKLALENALASANEQRAETEQAAAADSRALSEQVKALEEQLDLQQELEAAITEDLRSVSAKLDLQHEQAKAAEADLVGTLTLLRNLRGSMKEAHGAQLAAAENSLKAAMAEIQHLESQLCKARALSATERNKLLLPVEEAEKKVAAFEAHRDALSASHPEQTSHQTKITALQPAAESLQAEFVEAPLAGQAEPLQNTTHPPASRFTQASQGFLLSEEGHSVSTAALSDGSALEPQWCDSCSDAKHPEGGLKTESNGETATSAPADLHAELKQMRVALEELQARFLRQSEQHALEQASMREAFAARADAMNEDLEAKLEAIEILQPALQRAEEQLADTEDQLAKSQNALTDCQEMLEELQDFSERQAAELADLQAKREAEESGRKVAEQQLAKTEEAAAQITKQIDVLEQQVAALEKERAAQHASIDQLQTARDLLQSRLDVTRERLVKMEEASEQRLVFDSRRAQEERTAADEKLAALAQGMHESKEEYASRMDRLACQIGEEARRRAEAEAKALAYYQAHTQAQARSQEQNETLLRKIFEQEQAIKQLLSHHPDFTPNSRASMLNALSDTSLNRPAPLDGTPQPKALDFGRENMPAQHSMGSKSPEPAVLNVKSASKDSPSKAGFRHLHFNPVFGDRSPSRMKRAALQGNRHTQQPTSSQGSKVSLRDLPGNPGSPPLGNLRATSPHRWVKLGDKQGSPQWSCETDTHG